MAHNKTPALPEENDGPPPIPPEVLVQVLLCAQSLNAIVVGGQALTIWGERYFNDAPHDLAMFTPFQSKDVDYYGSFEEAEKLAGLLAGVAVPPDPNHVATVQSAAVMFTLNGVRHQVDFLHTVAGLSNRRMTSRAPTFQISVEQAFGLGLDSVDVTVLHPLDVLRTRIAGVTILRRRDAQAARQLGAAPVIAREYIRELLASGEEESLDEAQNAIREIIAVGSHRETDPVFEEMGVDILGRAAELADHSAWDPRFACHQIRAALERGIYNRARRRAARERNLAHRAR